MKISEIMTTDVMTVQPGTKISQAASLLLDNHINGLPVIDAENILVGIICQSDLIVQQKKLPLPTVFTLLDGLIPLTSMSHLEKEVQKMAATTVEQAMTKDPTSVSPDAELEDVADLMVKKNFHTIPVVQDGKLVGIVGKEDVLKTMLK
ncbi:CBS domain-containing protein [Desulfovermiculus halophilus]|jgi:CBS domain-containing protein|uniref:CBS domain-containing protein n=1 Tax=Desulfovermiculus halophilus TaxID=339722 RepID=UPI000486D715|nr:CBS domain-containing protein [Desulfovermiculus halophilus]